MNLRELTLIFLLTATLCVSSSPETNFNVPKSTSKFVRREKRQLGNGLRSAVRTLRRRINTIGHNIDRLVLPGVHYATEKIRNGFVPTSIADTVLDVTNKVILSTAEGIQKSAQFFNNEVAPVLEDTVIEVSNAAVPVVNKGIDVVGTGLRTGVNVVSKTTSSGIKHFGEKVLGEQRQNRIKKIANNISINLNNSINNLADVIKKVTSDEYYDYYNYNGILNTDVTNFEDYNSDLYNAMDSPQTQLTNDNYHNNERDTLITTKNMSIPQAFGKIMSNTAYSLSMRLLGPNLTEAVAPIARSVSSVIGQSVPTGTIANTELRPKEKLRTCTTPEGRRGFCQDLSECPNLILKLSVLRRSICLKALFSPGVCCPDVGQLQKIRDAERAEAEKLSQALTARPPQLASQNQFLSPQQRPGHLHPNFEAAYPGLTSQQQQLLLQQGLHHPLSPNTLQNALTAQLQAQLPHQSPVNEKMTRDNIIVNTLARNNNYECGVPKIPSSRVVGGEESYIGKWPWTAAIYLHGSKKTEFWCGGSLISEDFALTAAHCTKDAEEKTFDSEQFTVHLGDYSIFNIKDDRVSTPQIYKVRYIIPHPAFRRQGYFNDIALIKLSRSVEFSPFILPVCLPPEVLERSHLDALVGQTPSVIGYGSTTYDGPQSNTLRDVQLPIWKNSDCNKVYFQPITEIFLCAGYVQGGKDACQGDSGGPMQLYYNGRWVQLGIVSFGNRCAEPGYPGVYTRITQYLPWIRQNLR